MSDLAATRRNKQMRRENSARRDSELMRLALDIQGQPSDLINAARGKLNVQITEEYAASILARSRPIFD